MIRGHALLAFTLLGTGPAFAAEPVMTVAALPQPPALVAGHYFGGGESTIPFAVSVSTSEKFSLRARLVQISTDLTLPLTDFVRVAEGKTFSKDCQHGLAIDLPLPSVKIATRAFIELQNRKSETDSWQPAGNVFLVIHPPKEALLVSLNRAAERLRDLGYAFAVIGQEKFFSDPLTAAEIAFEEADSLGSGSGRIWLGRDLSETVGRDYRGKILVELTSDILGPEGLEIDASADHWRATINRHMTAPLPEAERLDLLHHLFSLIHRALIQND